MQSQSGKKKKLTAVANFSARGAGHSELLAGSFGIIFQFLFFFRYAFRPRGKLVLVQFVLLGESVEISRVIEEWALRRFLLR